MDDRPVIGQRLKEFQQREIDRILGACTACGKCFEVCPMAQYSKAPATDGKQVVPGVLAVLQGGQGSPEALGFWSDRLEAEGVAVERGESSLLFADPEGLQHELVVDESGDSPLVAVHPEIPAELALHGFEGVRAYSYRPQSTAAVLERLMNAESHDGDRWELRGDARRGWITLDPIPDEPARQSAGTIHHIAWNTTEAEHGRWLEVLQEAGIPNSGIVDRHYFRSIYFREPGGILFELATAEPGFTVDGPVEELGTRIILPPWLEQQRPAIESRLTPLPDPRADWAPVTR